MPTMMVPEEEPTRAERAAEVVTKAVAGQGIVRRVILYALIGIALTLAPFPANLTGITTLVLLMATDRNLE